MADDDQVLREHLAHKLGLIRDKSASLPARSLATFLGELAKILEDDLAEPFEDSVNPFQSGFAAGVRAAAEVLRTAAVESKPV
jgi:hypothetical protein